MNRKVRRSGSDWGMPSTLPELPDLFVNPLSEMNDAEYA
jgi:hypothetical protein